MENKTTPYIPEFTQYKDRNKWIIENAAYFTVIRRYKRRYQREERATLETAIELAQKLVQQDNTARFLIYGVSHDNHDALAATVSSEGIKYHE